MSHLTGLCSHQFCCSPDVILCGWLGLKHQLTNYLTSSIVCLIGISDVFIVASQQWSSRACQQPASTALCCLGLPSHYVLCSGCFGFGNTSIWPTFWLSVYRLLPPTPSPCLCLCLSLSLSWDRNFESAKKISCNSLVIFFKLSDGDIVPVLL